MVKVLYLVTGSCPQTEAEARLEMAEIREAEGDHRSAAEWRAIVEQMRAEWADRSEVGRVRRALGSEQPGPDPDALIEPLGTPENPMFWHEPSGRQNPLCPCGHFADYLCDEPIGKGKTCDMPACRCCRNEIRPDLDQCPFHAETQLRETRRMVPETNDAD